MKELNVNLKMVCFDMDGTIADLYGVKGWLDMLESHDPTPYMEANPMWNMVELAEVLMELKAVGIEIRVISWLSRSTTPEYDRLVRNAKREWLDENEFFADHIHLVKYGTTKADCVRKYLADDETAILIDDNAKVREGWRLGGTIDPTTCDLVEALRSLLP